jgi:valyl-tRNA synthetase
MGHALNITLQDILIRWKRMQGFNVLWVPGTDHAGIATQNVVERQLAEEGKKRTDLGRVKFEERVWSWKEKAEKNILRQIRRLGSSCDWSRQRFTLDEQLSKAVREVFVCLFEEGLIYRGEYLVNWCRRCGTAISDLEVEHRDSEGQLWYIRYPVKEEDQSVIVATTRPETMLGDTAVAVHPNDERYAGLAGKRIILPLLNREIPVVFDEFVDAQFGTGVVKVTPGHDRADFEAGQRHNLEIIKVIGADGKMTEPAGVYAGMDLLEARRRVVADLEVQGLLERVEDHSHKVGRCQRCHTVVEPLVSRQWFVKVRPLAEKAIEAVQEGHTVFTPNNYEKVYFEWMRNIHDWCISRQLWWGHRIPAWYCEVCDEMHVARQEPPKCTKCGNGSFAQETDVLDTWFSSALWPFSTLGWPSRTRELEVYYPTSSMVTGFDIIFFWVARMMMMGLRFMGKVPFRQVYINGLVRDEHGQKMSKSRGNIIDPLEIIDQYGTDAVRFTLAVMAVPGTDIPFSVSRMTGYRAFCNKIWNAARFLLLYQEEGEPVSEEDVRELYRGGRLALEDRWMLSRLQEIIAQTNRDLERFFVHEASNALYHFFWHQFCDWYLELKKNDITGDDSLRRSEALKITTFVFETSLRLLHPFIPFITEELWQKLPHVDKTLMLAHFPESQEDWLDQKAVKEMEDLQELITAIRTARAKNNIDPRKRARLELSCPEPDRLFIESQRHHLENLAGIDQMSFVAELSSAGLHARGVTRLAEFSLILDDAIDLSKERQRLLKEKDRILKEVEGLGRRLKNQDFLAKAPADVVARTDGRYQETMEKLQKVEETLQRLPT